MNKGRLLGPLTFAHPHRCDSSLSVSVSLSLCLSRFWDFRTAEVRDYFANKVLLAGATSPDVDGYFTDDPGGYGAEHPAVQAAVQLSDAEIVTLQRATQQAWTNGLALLTAAKKYIAQAYRITPAFAARPPQACTAWMRQMCAVPANESTLVFPQPSYPMAAANMSVASFLVARGPHSYLGAQYTVIEGGNWSDPLFRLHRLDTGTPAGACTEAPKGVFSRVWSKGKATVDCATATATLDFEMLQQ